MSAMGWTVPISTSVQVPSCLTPPTSLTLRTVNNGGCVDVALHQDSCVNVNGGHFCVCNAGESEPLSCHTRTFSLHFPLVVFGRFWQMVQANSCGFGRTETQKKIDSSPPGYTSATPSPILTCLDVNECATNNGGCPANVRCTNLLVTLSNNDPVPNSMPQQGTFRCECTTGYSQGTTLCTDINECAVNNGGCPLASAGALRSLLPDPNVQSRRQVGSARILRDRFFAGAERGFQGV